MLKADDKEQAITKILRLKFRILSLKMECFRWFLYKYWKLRRRLFSSMLSRVVLKQKNTRGKISAVSLSPIVS